MTWDFRAAWFALVILSWSSALWSDELPGEPDRKSAGNVVPDLVIVTDADPEQTRIAPSIPERGTKSTRTRYPERWIAKREITIEDALEIALSHSEVVRVLEGSRVELAETTSFDPELAAADVQKEAATWDPNVEIAQFTRLIDQPPDSFFGPEVISGTRRDEASWTANLIKPLATGGRARVGYNPSTGYLLFRDGVTSGFNPSLVSNVEFSVEQSLLKGRGSMVQTAPLMVAQVNQHQSELDLQLVLMQNVRSVEEAYWGLYASHSVLEALDELIVLLEEVVRVQKERLNAEWIIRGDLARSQVKLGEFVQSRHAAERDIRVRELRLRNLLRLPAVDDHELFPISEPMRDEVIYELDSSLEIALRHRPDLLRQQLELRKLIIDNLVAGNGMLPQLDVGLLYRLNGLEDSLGESWVQLMGSRFADWEAKMALTVPLGRRQAAAAVRRSDVSLRKAHAVFAQSQQAVHFELSDLWHQLAGTFAQYEAASARARDASTWARSAQVRYENPPLAGRNSDSLSVALNDYLLAVEEKAEAIRDASDLLADYNALLARMEEAQGTLLPSREVQLVPSWEDDDCSRNPATVSGQPLEVRTPSTRSTREGHHDPTRVSPTPPIPFQAPEVERLPPIQ